MGQRITSHEEENIASKEPETQQWRLRSYHNPTSADSKHNVNVCFVNERQAIEQGEDAFGGSFHLAVSRFR